ncbi:MAG TPA: TylF/MycF/NovP-related O-methyltransferase, partial [Candidatus Eremiobacteraceae bacterium]|nr:TylF/MycF/NovP-related O-methyltransferase [Candidatus Eremiobacteraceae bacterium]
LYDPSFQPWRSREWREKLHDGDPRSLVSLERKYVLVTLLSQALGRAAGDVAECGVYKGGTARIIAERLEGTGRRLELFDTFAGMPETNPKEDLHRAGDFGDTTLESVRAYLAGFSDVDFYAGLIPSSLHAVAGRTFCFVHVDLDLYDAIAAATAFFYPRVTAGGVFVYDDYGAGDCPGARKAVDEFFAGRPEVPLVLGTGQCIVVKV